MPKDPQCRLSQFGLAKVGAIGSAPYVKAQSKNDAICDRSPKRRSSPGLWAFKSKNDWFRWAKSGDRPDDIPANPADSYEKDGWPGWANFLGTKNKKAGEIVYRDFVAAREWARSQRLQSQAEWKALAASGRLPADIPASPWRVYREKGWTTIGDWLGKGERHSKNKQWRNFVEARDYVRALGLQQLGGIRCILQNRQTTCDIPAEPDRVYQGLGWISRGDWLGTDTVASTKRQFLSFEKAREFVRARGFQTKTEYEAWARSNERPSDIPALPSRTYARTGWLGWGDWLGAYKRWNKTSILSVCHKHRATARSVPAK